MENVQTHAVHPVSCKGGEFPSGSQAEWDLCDCGSVRDNLRFRCEGDCPHDPAELRAPDGGTDIGLLCGSCGEWVVQEDLPKALAVYRFANFEPTEHNDEKIKQIEESLRVTREQRTALDEDVRKLVKQESALRLQLSKLTHPCGCVELNGDLDIQDAIEQSSRGRRGIGLGRVSETLSALKSCPLCLGTGKPNK